MTRKPKPIRDREAAPAPEAPFARHDGRAPRSPRPFKIERGVMSHAEGSALVVMGRTRVLCSASVEDRVPGWLRNSGKGWVTAEYGMLPRATGTRTPRTSQTGGRAQEIQRLIGRSLRAVTDLTAFGERTVTLDCDVLEADGGTRTAAITGAFVAAHDAVSTLLASGALGRTPVRDFVAAVSVGLYGGTAVLDLDYAEDSACDTDLNVVMTGAGGFVEVQGTAEGEPFTREQMNRLVDLAATGIRRLVDAQRAALGA